MDVSKFEYTRTQKSRDVDVCLHEYVYTWGVEYYGVNCGAGLSPGSVVYGRFSPASYFTSFMWPYHLLTCRRKIMVYYGFIAGVK